MLREDPAVKALLVDVLPIYNELNSRDGVHRLSIQKQLVPSAVSVAAKRGRYQAMDF
jgi:hypothetical protein